MADFDELIDDLACAESFDEHDTARLALTTAISALQADAETSQNHNAGVIDRIVAQLRDAGYTGTLSEMVDEVLETPDPRVEA